MIDLSGGTISENLADATEVLDFLKFDNRNYNGLFTKSSFISAVLLSTLTKAVAINTSNNKRTAGVMRLEELDRNGNFEKILGRISHAGKSNK